MTSLTPEWAIAVSQPMNLRVENDQLVLWHPGLTAWISVWGDKDAEPPAAVLDRIYRPHPRPRMTDLLRP